MDEAALSLSGRQVDLGTGRVSPGAEALTRHELELLGFLAAHPRETLGRGLLLERVWGYRSTMNTRTVDMTIRRLRAKIEADPAHPVHVLTMPGEGYRFEPLGAPSPAEVRFVAVTRGDDLDPAHDAALRSTAGARGGRVQGATERGLQVGFADAWAALRWCLDAQPSLAMCTVIHAAGPEAAAIASAVAGLAHGRQIVVTGAAHAAIAERLAHSPDLRGLPLGRRDVPGADALELYEVRRAEDADVAYPPLREVVRARTNLLPEAPTLHGRADDLENVARALETGRLVTLVGTGGAGKTRLARELGLRQQDAWFCDLTQAVTAEGICGIVGQVLGASANARDPVDQVGGALARRGKLLLILDNLEQVVDVAARVVDRWLALSPSTTFLATSREPLRIAGERVIRIAPLEVPPPGAPVETSEAYPAVALFLERARHLKPGLEATEAVAELVRRLDGLPLAIQLAAARANLLPPEAMLRRIDERFTLLAGGRRDLPARHETLRATIAWSWDLLGPAEQDALAQCAVFRGGFDLDAAEGVLDLAAHGLSVLDAIEGLLARSLLVDTTVDGEVRLGMLESIHAFAREALEVSGRAATVEARHGAWFASRGESWAGRPMGVLGPDLRRDRLETENFLAATQRAVARGDAEIAGSCAEAACFLVYCSGGLRPIPRIAEPVLALPDLPQRHRRRLLFRVARAASRLGDRPRALECVDELMATAREANDLREVARTTIMGARVRTPDASAEPHFMDAMAQVRALGDRKLEGEVLANLGLLYSARSRLAESLACLEEAMVLHRETGDLESQAATLGNLANALLQAGDSDRALRLFDESDALALSLGERQMLAVNHINRGGAFLELGRLDEAEAECRRALDGLRGSGGHGNEAIVLTMLAEVELRRGRIDAAEALAVAAVPDARAGGNEIATSQALLYRARIHVLRGRIDEATRDLAEGRAVAAAGSCEAEPQIRSLIADIEASMARYSTERSRA